MFELKLETLEGLPKNGPTDPIEYYRRPLTGAIFRKRINLGLDLLPQRRFRSALEIGYGAGAVQLTLASGVEELHGIDLDADAELVTRLLGERGKTALLKQGSVYDLPYGDGAFELCVSFSTFEHLHEYERALGEVWRVLEPGGLFLLGMPAVNRMMELGFRAIGFKGIEDHHVTTPQQAIRAARAMGFVERGSATLGLPWRAPLGVSVYYDWLLEKPVGRSAPVP
jgi:SAM-dependent methyltransferase